METYRRDYILPPDDTEYLNNTFPGWESIEGGWVLIPNYPLPAGFTVAHTTVAIQIPPAYPEGQLDMASFYPSVLRADGKHIPNTDVMQTIDGKAFQRWSRHYLPGSWRPNIDNIATHLLAVDGWFERALEG